MGGSSSVSTTTVNEVVTNSVVTLSKLCSAVATNTYDINVAYVEGDVTISGNVLQEADATAICDQNSVIQTAIKADMMSKIKANSESKDTSLLTGDVGFFNSASANVNSTNRALMKLSTNDLQHCVTNAKNSYVAEFEQVNGNLTIDAYFKQTANADISKCLLNTGVEQNLAFDLKQDVDASAKRKGTLDTLLENLVPFIIVIVVVAAIVFSIMIYLRTRSKKPAAPTIVAISAPSAAGLASSSTA